MTPVLSLFFEQVCQMRRARRGGRAALKPLERILPAFLVRRASRNRALRRRDGDRA
jgi:hypothetical protein